MIETVTKTLQDPSSNKLIFATDRHHYRKLQLIKMPTCETVSTNTPDTLQRLHPRLTGHCGQGGGKTERTRRIGSLLLDCLLEMSEATAVKSHQHGCLNMS